MTTPADNLNIELLKATFVGDKVKINEYLERGVNVNCQDEDGGTPLELAIFKSHNEIVDLLIQKGANVNHVNPKIELTYLWGACFRGKAQVVQSLLNAGAHVNWVAPQDNTTPLFMAASEGHLETVKILLRADANPKIPNLSNQLPIDIAKMKMHAEIVEELTKNQNKCTIPRLDCTKITANRTLVDHPTDVTAITYSPDGRMLASGSKDGTIKIWSTADGKVINSLSGHSAEISALAFTPDSKLLASSCPLEYSVKIWAVQDGSEIRKFPSIYANSFSISPIGDMIAVADGLPANKISIYLFDDSKNIIKTLSEHTSLVTSITFSPVGRVLISGSMDEIIKIWSVREGKLIRRIEHPDAVGSIAISPDGTLIASINSVTKLADNTIQLWSLNTGKNLRTFKGHSDIVESIAFSPCGTLLVSGSGDKTVRIWSVADGSELAVLNGHSSKISSVAFSPDGKSIASGSHDKTIKIWSSEKPLEEPSEKPSVETNSQDNTIKTSPSEKPRKSGLLSSIKDKFAKRSNS
jgi:WD40 repeat protein